MSLTKHETRSLRTLDAPWSEMFDLSWPDRLRGLFSTDMPFDRAFDIGGRLMRIEEFADDHDLVVRAELPGIDPDKNVEISVEDGVLRIAATREERTESERPDGYRSEFHYGTFMRSFRMPEGSSEDDVRATYKDGILEVRVPIPAEPAVKAPHKVEIGRG